MTPVTLGMVVGDTLDWDDFASPLHDAYVTPAGDCNFTGATQLDVAGFGASYTFASVGTYNFGCAVSTHCASQGMSVTVTVTVAPLAAPALSPWAIGGTMVLLMGMLEVARRRMSFARIS